MRLNFRRGILRIIVIVIGLWELMLICVAIAEIHNYARANPFDKFDVGYTPLSSILENIGIAAFVLPFIFIGGWFLTAWILRGFKPETE